VDGIGGLVWLCIERLHFVVGHSGAKKDMTRKEKVTVDEQKEEQAVQLVTNSVICRPFLKKGHSKLLSLHL
jgi:hypothetical protein